MVNIVKIKLLIALARDVYAWRLALEKENQTEIWTWKIAVLRSVSRRRAMRFCANSAKMERRQVGGTTPVGWRQTDDTPLSVSFRAPRSDRAISTVNMRKNVKLFRSGHNAGRSVLLSRPSTMTDTDWPRKPPFLSTLGASIRFSQLYPRAVGKKDGYTAWTCSAKSYRFPVENQSNRSRR